MTTMTMEEMEQEIRALRHELGMQQDVHAIRRLQHAYGYYLDKCLYDEVVDLFCDDCEVRFGGGRFLGKAGIKRLFLDRFRKRFTGGYNGPVQGFLLDHPMFQDIVTVADDRSTARVRMRVFMQAGTHISQGKVAADRMQQWWEGGIYENQYVREDGIWKIKLLNYNVIFFGSFEDGWANWDRPETGRINTLYPEDPIGADELMSPVPGRWPDTPVIPFHYNHPVTGKPWKPAKRES